MTGRSSRGTPDDQGAGRDGRVAGQDRLVTGQDRRAAGQGGQTTDRGGRGRATAGDGSTLTQSGRAAARTGPTAPESGPVTTSGVPGAAQDAPAQSVSTHGSRAKGAPGQATPASGELTSRNQQADALQRNQQAASRPATPAVPPGPHRHHHGHGHGHNHGHSGNRTSWSDARLRAVQAGLAQRAAGHDRPHLHPTPVPLDHALGLMTAAPLIALTDLPPFDTSAMDGWAVAGPGPWLIRGEREGGRPTVDHGHRASLTGDGTDRAAPDRHTGQVDRAPADHRAHQVSHLGFRPGQTLLAGHHDPEPLDDGEAVPIATGARIPHDTTAVLRSEYGSTDTRGRLHASHDVAYGQDIRPRGQECRRGERLLPGGVLITPAVLGLAAAAGYDELLTAPGPRADVLVLGDELLTEGLPHDGLIRDALGPMLPPWLRALGAEVIAVRRLGDDAGALYRAIVESDADLLVTTGGTAAGPLDHVHPTLRRIGAELLVDGVAVRPGHPMLLARTKEHQHLVGLPGNPLAAVSGLLTLAEPFLRALRGLAEPGTDTGTGTNPNTGSDSGPFVTAGSASLVHPLTTLHGTPAPRLPSPHAYAAVVRDVVQGHPQDTRLVPVVLRSGDAVPLHYNGPAMLRGIAAADALAVVPPGGAEADQKLEILDLPWATSGSGAQEAWSLPASGECFT